MASLNIRGKILWQSIMKCFLTLTRQKSLSSSLHMLGMHILKHNVDIGSNHLERRRSDLQL